jgi:TetR/AcrR family transcriptional repressor of nem operon
MAGVSEHRPVGRPREFDEATVLVAAMEAFWRHGYEATSLADLCRYTGLNKGSLYQTFGDKHQLFMKALEHYAEMAFRDVASVAFQSESPLENIRAVIEKICSDSCEEKGCMMINSIVELAPHDPQVKALLQQVAAKRVRILVDLIEKAQQAGEIRAELEPKKLAQQFMVMVAGAAALAKGLLDPSEAVGVIEDLVASWT